MQNEIVFYEGQYTETVIRAHSAHTAVLNPGF